MRCRAWVWLRYVHAVCVFRKSVTGRFGIVTAEFGNVTERFGDVTDGVFVTRSEERRVGKECA